MAMPTDAELMSMLTEQVSDLSNNIHNEREARRLSIIVGGVVLVLMLVFVGLLWRQNNEIISARTDGRITACNSQNTLIDPINDIIAGFTATRPGTPRTDEEQASVNATVAQILLKRRVCTPSGIAAYIRHDLDNAYEDSPQAKALKGSK